jgi:hypothetical protein
MQAYQSAPCPYCGATWNPPGAQVCAHCRNPLPQPPPAYGPPGYAPGQGGAPPQPGQAGVAPQPGQAPAQYTQAPRYPGGGQPYPAPPYPAGSPQQPYAPPGYPPASYPQTPYGGPPGYPPPAGYPGQPAYPFPAPYAAPPVIPYTEQRPPDAPAPTTARAPSAILMALTAALARLQTAPRSRIVVGAGVIAVGLLVFAILPAVASGQISAANQAVGAAIKHQHSVDSVMALFLTHAGSQPVDPNGERAVVSASLATVQADESSIGAVDQHLAWLAFAALPKHQAIANQRARIAAALRALQNADRVLTAAADQTQLALTLLDAQGDYVKMAAAVTKHDLTQADAPYADAQRQLDQAAQLVTSPGIPPVQSQQVQTLTALVSDSEQMIQAIQSKDAAGTQKYSALVQAEAKAMNGYNPSAIDTWNAKTFTPLIKAYDAGLKNLPAG